MPTPSRPSSCGSGRVGSTPTGLGEPAAASPPTPCASRSIDRCRLNGYVVRSHRGPASMQSRTARSRLLSPAREGHRARRMSARDGEAIQLSRSTAFQSRASEPIACWPQPGRDRCRAPPPASWNRRSARLSRLRPMSSHRRNRREPQLQLLVEGDPLLRSAVLPWREREPRGHDVRHIDRLIRGRGRPAPSMHDGPTSVYLVSLAGRRATAREAEGSRARRQVELEAVSHRRPSLRECCGESGV